MDDWDRKPKDPPSQFLRLKSKGESCRIRIATAPYRELRVWPAGADRQPPIKSEILADLTPGQWLSLMRDPNYDVQEVYHLVVIDRADNMAKIFTTTPGVYGKIRDYAKNPEWGDPKGYDITVTRTEQPGKNYYEVIPSPNKTQILSSDLELVDKLNVRKMLPAALPAASAQPDDIGDTTEPEPLPWLTSPKAPASNTPSQPTASPVTEGDTFAGTPDPKKTAKRTHGPAADPENDQPGTDVVIDDFDPDEPINLDDIPF